MYSPSTQKSGYSRLVKKVIVPVLIILLTGGIAFSIVKTAPHPERKVKTRQARLVEIFEVLLNKHPLTIDAWGNVQAAQQITLRAQVNGEIREVSPEFVPGGKFRKGEVILRLNPADYILTVRQREADLAKARADLQLEQGNQVVARKEFELLGEVIGEREKSLVLRLPQLNAAKGAVESAEAALQTAKLALSRTVLTAPFDATVLRRHVDLGTYISTTTDLVTLVGTKEYWVELAIPSAQLRWLTIPQTPQELGSSVKLFHDNVWGTNVFRTGRVIRLLTDLETEGRMARLLVAIDDPLNIHESKPGVPQVLLGSYLRAEIEGREIDQTAKLDRHWVHDQETVWLLNEDNSLEIRRISIAFRGRDHVFVSEGLHTGDRIIITDIAAPKPGMSLRLNEDPPSTPEPQPSPQKNVEDHGN